VNDPLYNQKSTKHRLEETDKFLWAPVGITQYDTLIQKHYESKGYTEDIPEKISEVWAGIKKGYIDPFLFLERPDLMRKRLDKITDFFGSERILYASPECGLNSFPGYSVALETLRRACTVISGYEY
jgi:methionine synthase II (cobalamin-independent)